MNLLRLLVPIAEAASLTDKSSETAEQSEEAVTSFITYLWDHIDNWIAAVIVVVFSIYFSKMIKKVVVDKVADKMGDEHEEILILVGRATYAAVLAVGLTIGLKVGGIDLTVIIAAVGFGIGFALQDILMNFIAGVIILASRQFAIGDFIEVNGTLGKVKEIQSRATILQALDGTKVIVPNADLFTNQVTSYTTNPFRRIEVPVGVEYRTDLKKATNVMLAVLHAHPRIMKQPAPAVILDEFADSSINFKVRFWVESKDKWINIKSEVIEQVKSALDEAGISIPFPIRTLAFDRDTEAAVVPTYAMTAEEMKQHKMEQIEAQEDQAAKDAANTALQTEYAEGDSHTEHVDLETLEEEHAAAEAEKVPVASEKAEVRSEKSEGSEKAESRSEKSEGSEKAESRSEKSEGSEKAESRSEKSAEAESQPSEVASPVESEIRNQKSEEEAAVEPAAEAAPEVTTPQSAEPAPQPEVAAAEEAAPQPEVAEQPAPAEPAPQPEVAPEEVAAPTSDASPQPETPVVADAPAVVDATATVAPVQPQLATETVPVAAEEEPQKEVSSDVAGADFLST